MGRYVSFHERFTTVKYTRFCKVDQVDQVGEKRVLSHFGLPASNRDHFRAGGQGGGKVSPGLQHLSALPQEFGPIVSGPHFVTGLMRQLSFNRIRRPTLFVQ